MCSIQWLGTFLLLVVVLLLAVFVFALAKRSREIYKEQAVKTNEMMERQKESVALLREIRDLLKK
jgi:large-conductance mechanosensitive channel